MPVHVLRVNESIYTLAHRHGLSVDAIWNHGQNRALKDARKKPGVLRAGDEVFIPEARAAEFTVPTAQRHRFACKTTTVQWSVQFRTWEGPRAGWTYTARVDGAQSTGTLDNDGWIRLQIAAHSQRIEVALTPPEDTPADRHGRPRVAVSHVFRLHGLDPADTPSGVRQRLRAMGVTLSGPLNEWDPRLRAALRHFQSQNGLEATGEMNSATRDRLESLVEP